MILKNGLVFTEEGQFSPLTITTDGDRITKLSEDTVQPSDTSEIFDASGCYIVPGLTDIHFHGCAGHDFCDGTEEAFDAIAAYEFTQGVTTICPATMTLSADILSDILKSAAAYAKSQQKADAPADRAALVGIHMEGPFINVNKKGAQNASYIQLPTAEAIRRWQKDAEGLVRLISLAPEVEGAVDCIKECSKEFRFSIAHTESDYDTAMKAFAAGADHVTHLYNAMPPFTHRAPGVIGAASDTLNSFVELICDGVHIAPSVVRATFRLFGADRVILISDSMEATGKPDGTYSLGGLEVHVNGSHATLSDGTLAGSVTPLYRCVLTAISMGIPLESAIKAATINPCRSIGIDHDYGSIRVGKKAHFLILNKNDLSIKAVIKCSKS
ncbi:MAG: N-acetylglucosamine-6-phosphate deacetylase [Lachnospiraceae bacterium]|nr:N-acetylglucosamine-6-phosphate deacetylase [Lachnospiraceae bacterium]